MCHFLERSPRLRHPTHAIALILLFLSFMTLFPLGAIPLGPQSTFLTMTARDGLSNSSVSSIVQDSTGFIWFGTQGGLNRFDGHDFKLFANEPFQTNGLSHNLIQTMYLDNDILWIGTYGGLNRFELRTENFTVFRNEPGDPASLSHDVVVSVYRDERGTLWVGTLDGLNRMDEQTGSFIRYANDPENPRSVPGKVIRSMKTDPNGHLWIGTNGGLCTYDPQHDDFMVYRHSEANPGSIPSDMVMSIDLDPQGQLWLGCWGGGLARFDPNSGKTIQVIKLDDDRIYVINASSPEAVHVGTWGGGLFEVFTATGVTTRYTASSNRGALSHDTIYSILRDRSGELWIGTNGGGVNKLSEASRGFDAIVADPEKPTTLPPGKIQSILVDRSGTLWVAVYNGGLNRWIPGKDEWKHYRNDKKNPHSLPNDIPNAIFEDAGGSLWIGTNGGLARYRPPSDDFEVILPDPENPNSLSSSIIYCFADAPGGNLWIGTYEAGIDYWNRKTNVFTHFPHDPANPRSLSDNLVYKMVYDHQGHLWVGTNRGLNRQEGNGFVNYLYDPANTTGISSNSIRDILLDSSNELWIGSSGGGLMRWNQSNDSFEHFTKQDGLPSNSISRVLESHQGDLWIATQAGLVTWERTSGHFQNLTVWNDLRDREFNLGGAIASDGSLYFGSLGQLYRFKPEHIEVNTVAPAVAITALEVAGKNRHFPLATQYLASIDIAYDENSIKFAFAALDFRDPGRNRYSYRLEGFDKEWMAGDSRRVATYTNLPGGDYVFRVRAANSDGIWNMDGSSLEVHVATPPWFSWPAIIGYALVIALIVFLITQSRNRQILAAKVQELLAVKSQLEAANQQLAYLSGIDPLTGIANRRRLDEILYTLFAGAIRNREWIAGIMIDIDHFKAYNDHYGHQAGDDCLRRVAAAITASLDRTTDFVARFGGEEFLVLLPNTELHGAVKVAEKIRLAVAALDIPHEHSETARVTTVSLGLAALLPRSDQTPEELVSLADQRLYQAKSGGRNCVVG